MPVCSASTHRNDWDDLRYVLAVAEAGSLAGAARVLQVNHTTVLRRLAAYEERLGVRLFERLPTGYVPTPPGDEMVVALRGIDEAIHDVERRAAGRDLRLSGNVRLATADTLAVSVLPAALARLRQAHPGISLEITTANAPVVLTRREADIALRPTGAPPEALIGRRICSLGYAIYGSPAYLLAREPGHSLRDHAWVAPDESLRDAASARWMRATLPGEEAVRAGSLVTIRDLATAGLGLALLPCYLGDTSPGLIRLPGHSSLDLGVALWLLTHEDLRRTARIDAVVTSLATELGALRALLEGTSDVTLGIPGA